MAPIVFVKPSRLRVGGRRHPWVRAGDVGKLEGSPQDGDAVEVRARDGSFVAHGLFNSASYYRVRLLSFVKRRPIDEALLRGRVRDAVALRHEVLRLPERTDAYRLINSEGDGLPGLVVDRYGDVLNVSCGSLGLYQRMDPILDELAEALSPRAIIEVDPPGDVRAKEGIPEPRGVVRGELPADEGIVTIDGLKLRVRYAAGQKTGLFLDQRETVRRVASLAAGRRVLDACCYVGTFGLACALAGASSALLFDTSALAVERAQENAELNGVADRVEVRRAQLFRELHGLSDAGERFDLIVLDPPKFVKSKRDLEAGRKGYQDANRLALRLLNPGGLLLTCSCSHHMTPERFAGLLRESALHAGARLRFLEEHGAGPDHPLDLQCPEGRYLKAFLLQRTC